MPCVVETRFVTMVSVKYTDCHHGPNAFLLEEIVGKEVDLYSSPCKINNFPGLPMQEEHHVFLLRDVWKRDSGADRHRD
jgi:hypothetical protein